MAASLTQKIPWRFYRLSCHNAKHQLSRNQHFFAPQSEYTDVAEYPPIKPAFPPGINWGDTPRKLAWQCHEEKEEVAQIKTAKGKIDNLAKEYQTWLFPATQMQPLVLDYQLEIMKTTLIEGLPLLYTQLDTSEDIEICKKAVMEAISVEQAICRQRFFQKRKLLNPSAAYQMTHLHVKEILNSLYFSLVGRHDHLLNAEFDDTVKVQAFWDRYGVRRKKSEKFYTYKNYHIEKHSRFQAAHDVDFQIRTEQPLPEFYPRDHEGFKLDAPKYEYYPSVVGQFQEKTKHCVSTGANLGSPNEFTLLSVLQPNHKQLLRVLARSGKDAYEQNVLGYGVVNGFVSTVAQAYYQGFNTFEELTYPFTNQTIITDGQSYHFYAYQLNTLHLWLSDGGNPLRNACWHSGPHKLYDSIEDGKIQGFNDETFKMLLRFLTLKPVDRGYNLRPNLDADDTPFGVDKYIPREKELVETKEFIQYAPER